MNEDLDEFVTIERRRIPPDPGILKAIGLNHSLESAIADLVDNSIDAGATNILIRLVLSGHLVRRLLVVDNGNGMDATEIDDAMRLGREKPDSAKALGRFGMGLKSASFSQASSLTVLSRKAGSAAQGRRMLREESGSDFECSVLGQAEVETALNAPWPGFQTAGGTIVLWDMLRNFPSSADPKVTDTYIESARDRLQHHLGLTFHRLLERGAISVAIDVFDAASGEAGLMFEVVPIDPLGYSRTGAPGYPKTMIAAVGRSGVPLACHIWPGGSDSTCFKLAGATADRFQGFYFYRNDRLLSAGGWNGVVSENRALKLARVVVDIEGHLGLFNMSVEKARVRMVPDLVRAVEMAEAADGVTFKSYLETAEEVFRASNRRTYSRKPLLPPGKGLHPKVRRAIAREAGIVEGESPIEIRWKALSSDDFVEVDRVRRILWLNSRYREAVLRGEHGGVNDAPLIKALLFLLFEDIFKGANMGVKDKDSLAVWQEILTSAVLAESDSFDE